LGLFWPEASHELARHALNQALHVLRSELGEGAVRSRGDSDVAIDEAAISCDVVEFEQAVDAGEYEQALELYRGDLLEGLFVREASEFERWLEDERTRLREKAAGAAWALAHEHIAADRLVDAERTAQRALLLVATDESEVRRFIEALADAGDRAAAVRFYEKFAQKLQDEYEIEPAPVTVECAQRIRNPESDKRPPAQESAETWEMAQATGTLEEQVGGRPRPRRLVAGAAAIVLAATVFVLANRPEPSDTLPDINPNLVLIGPFRVTAAPDMEAWRNGMVEMLHARFNGEGIPSAVDPSWAIEQWGNAGERSGDLTPVTAVGLAEQIGAGQLIMGSIVGNATAFEMSAQLYTVPGGERIAQATVMGSEAELVRGLVDRLVLELVGSQIQPEGLGLTNSLPAMRAYFAARDARRRGRMLVALQSYDRALATDSNFILAGYGLWRVCRRFGHPSTFECARQERIRFFRPDDLPQRERTIYASSNRELSNRERIRLADEAAQRYPGDAFAWYRQAYHWFRLGSYLHPDSVAIPRAAAAIERALQLDPANLPYLGQAIEIAAFGRDTSKLERYRNLYVQHSDSTDFLRPYHLWLAAYGRGDSAAIREVLELIETKVRTEDFAVIDPFNWRISYSTVLYGFPHDAVRILHQAGSPYGFGTMVYGLVEGRANDVTRIVEEIQPQISDCPTCDFGDLLTTDVLWSAFFSSGFEEAGTIAARGLVPHVQLAPDKFQSGMCWVQLWSLDRENDVAGTRAMLEAAGRAELADDPECLGLAAALEAKVDPNGPAPKLEALDSVMAEGSVCTLQNLLITDLWTARGEYDRALAAVRRRRNRWPIACGPYQLPEFLVREGRLAAMLGDTAVAIAAYDHYLKLRTNPDSGVLMEERLAVERHLAELGGNGR
jgi:DNA-binding SARP family transcriptional activator